MNRKGTAAFATLMNCRAAAPSLMLEFKILSFVYFLEKV